MVWTRHDHKLESYGVDKTRTLYKYMDFMHSRRSRYSAHQP